MRAIHLLFLRRWKQAFKVFFKVTAYRLLNYSENFYGVEEEEDSSEAGLPGFGSFVDDGVAASKDRAAELISEGSRPEGRQRKVIKKMKIKA